MADIVPRKTRSRMMSNIRSGDTKPEVRVRRFLHAAGFRFRLHRNDLPGKPDIVLPRYDAAIFVHGCFWHRHDGCHYASQPATRPEFWSKKFSANVARDKRNVRELQARGWRVLIIWECGTKHRLQSLDEIAAFIESSNNFAEWPDQPPRRRSI